MSKEPLSFPVSLERPLAFFDVEATGIRPRIDRILELAVGTVFPSGERRFHVFRFNPGMPIPPESTAIHGITDADVAHARSFADQADLVVAAFGDSDLAGYNLSRFDIPILVEECVRAGRTFDVESRRVIDVQRIFHRREPRDLTAALRFYCGELHLDAHGAEGDVLATIRVLEGQFQRYGDLPRSVAELHDYCETRRPDWVDRTGRLRWQNREVVLNFGRKNGTPLRRIIEEDPSFIRWVLNGDFPRDMQEIIRKAAHENQWPTPPAEAVPEAD